MTSFFNFVARLSAFAAANWRALLGATAEHLELVAVAVGVAVAIGVPLGLWLTRHRRWQRSVLGFVGVLQTVPSLALFGLLIPLPFVGGIGARTAIIALVLYALLPVVRNTVVGIEGVDANVRAAAIAMGMTDWQLLWQVELPLASGVLLAGVRVATVINVGVATIAAAIGAGGLGTYIFRGLRMNDNVFVLAGALPAALLALAADWLLGLLEAHLAVGARSADSRQRAQRQRRRRRIVWATTLGLAVVLVGGGFAYARWHRTRADVVVGAKDFTEQLILGELMAQMCEARGLRIERRFELGGNLCHDALVAGEIDAYPEYSGTSLTAILKRPLDTDPRRVYQQITNDYAERFDVEVGPPLGFENTFAILVRGADARALNLRTVSDARAVVQKWRAGFGQDFLSRPDGYDGFVRAYELHFDAAPREMDLSLTYRALAARQVDIIAGNSTDGLIATLDLFQLTDDRRYFPPYEAIFLARRDALERAPAMRDVLQRLGGAISTEEMRTLNYEVDGEKRAVADVVRRWRARKGL